MTQTLNEFMTRFRVSVPKTSFEETKALIYDYKIGFESYWPGPEGNRKIQFRSAENMGKLVDKLEHRGIDFEMNRHT